MKLQVASTKPQAPNPKVGEKLEIRSTKDETPSSKGQIPKWEGKLEIRNTKDEAPNYKSQAPNRKSANPKYEALSLTFVIPAEAGIQSGLLLSI